MALDSRDLLDALVSHAASLGYFDRVSTHEPKNAPGNGLTAAIWVQQIRPTTRSGLAATSAVVVVNVRIMSNMMAEPQDEIDPNIMDATDALLNAYSGDFQLDDMIRNVDLLGSEGVPLSAQAGYLSINNSMYRVMTITVPMIKNDVWTQVP